MRAGHLHTAVCKTMGLVSNYFTKIPMIHTHNVILSYCHIQQYDCLVQ